MHLYLAERRFYTYMHYSAVIVQLHVLGQLHCALLEYPE